MSRWRAFAIHLGISLIIFAALAFLVVQVWYPDFFFATDGGWQGIRIIVAVDLVLGPLLTLIVYKHGKPGLKMDLTLIGLFQFVCLLAGTYIVYIERPIAVVFVDSVFTSMSAGSYTDSGVEVPDFSKFPGKSPKWVTVELPSDPLEQSNVRREAMAKKHPLTLAYDHYKPFDSSDPMVKSDSFDITKVKVRDDQINGLDKFLEEHGGVVNDYRFHMFGTRFDYLFLAFRKSDDSFAGLVDAPVNR